MSSKHTVNRLNILTNLKVSNFNNCGLYVILINLYNPATMSGTGLQQVLATHSYTSANAYTARI